MPMRTPAAPPTITPVRSRLRRALAAAGAVSLLATACDRSPSEPQSEPGLISFERSSASGRDIYIVRSDGTAPPIRLTSDAADDIAASWSPDGLRILFSSHREGNYELYLTNADGSGVPTRLTQHAADDLDAVISPDGQRIAVSRQGPAGAGLVLLDIAGQTLPPTSISPSGLDALCPSWSPDGTKIAFQGRAPGAASRSEIYIMGRDERGTATQLTDDQTGYLCPVWSPGGTRLAFSNLREGVYKVYVMNADGSGAPRRLTSDPANEGVPPLGAVGRGGAAA
jgi:TolB protein